MSDRDLLREYVLNHSEKAFAELVGRHINLVYAAARRVVGDAELAKDITQSTFIHLAERAASVRDGDALPGWLYRVACNLATSAVRSESRRREREQTAMKLAELDQPDASAWGAVAPMLEEAMQRLNAGEQDAVVLRFLEGKSLREVGLALNLSDDAAQKRVSRALDKMRIHFSRHGVTASAALLGTLLAANSVQAAAPPDLAASVAGGAFAGAKLAGGAGVAGAAMKHLFTKKVLAALVAAGMATVVIWQFRSGAKATGTPDASAPPAAPARSLTGSTESGTPGALTFETPLNAASGGPSSQFSLSSMRTVGNETDVVRGEGTVTALPNGENATDATPREYFLEYQISWQVFSSTPGVNPGQANSSKDDFEIRSSATLTPNTPFPLMRVEGKTVTVTTDGRKITLQITKAP